MPALGSLQATGVIMNALLFDWLAPAATTKSPKSPKSSKRDSNNNNQHHYKNESQSQRHNPNGPPTLPSATDNAAPLPPPVTASPSTTLLLLLRSGDSTDASTSSPEYPNSPSSSSSTHPLSTSTSTSHSSSSSLREPLTPDDDTHCALRRGLPVTSPIDIATSGTRHTSSSPASQRNKNYYYNIDKNTTDFLDHETPNSVIMSGTAFDSAMGKSRQDSFAGAKPIAMTNPNRHNESRQRRESLAGSLVQGMSWGGVSVGSWIRDE